MIDVDLKGKPMPALGFGTFRLQGDDCERSVFEALAVGYRHIDTAEMYGNEVEVGAALERSGLARDEVFLTTKVWPTRLAPSDLRASILGSLDDLRTDRVDLALIHWPSRQYPLEASLSALCALQQSGHVDRIGVSNFAPSGLAQATSIAATLGTEIACLQVEYHPWLGQRALLEQCAQHGIVLTAYAPIARGLVLDESILIETAARHRKTPAQVCLRWLIEQDRVVAVPKAETAAHRIENFDIFDFSLDREEVAAIATLACGRRLVDPLGLAPDWEG